MASFLTEDLGESGSYSISFRLNLKHDADRRVARYLQAQFERYEKKPREAIIEALVTVILLEELPHEVITANLNVQSMLEIVLENQAQLLEQVAQLKARGMTWPPGVVRPPKNGTSSPQNGGDKLDDAAIESVLQRVRPLR